MTSPAFVSSPILIPCRRPSCTPISVRPFHAPARLTPTASITEQPSRVSGGGVAKSADHFTQYDGQSPEQFARLAADPQVRMLPLWRKVFSDQLTPVVTYRCLVPEDDIQLPSFLLESVHTGERVGRYSLIGARPIQEVIAYAHDVTIVTHQAGRRVEKHVHSDDPWNLIAQLNSGMKPVSPDCLPGGAAVFSGGWVGYGGYDTMRYAELKSLPFSAAPVDDRGLPDLHVGLYEDVIVFDHVAKLIYVMHWVDLQKYANGATDASISEAYEDGISHLNKLTSTIVKGVPLSPMSPGTVNINTDAAASTANKSNMTKEQFMESLEKINHHIRVGDTFQTVFSQRFERWSEADPFSVYRALRIINPSPYMIYMQCKGSTLVASSPEILTRVEQGVLTNRPLAGTRRRGITEEEDKQLEEELLEDGKDRSEHMMLVDLGRNDVGKVSEYGSVNPEKVMVVEKFSHVMHISSTITGKVREGLTSWDALRATLPAGTISGAPKIRAMQIIDDLEPTKRGPYGGGIGYISFYDTMNMALALRTMVVPNEPKIDEEGRKQWLYYMQAGAGIVFESDPEAEYNETVNKAMALSRAIDLAENAYDS